MSITWTAKRVGYDGDFLYGDVSVGYWVPREDFAAELATQLDMVREGMLAERDRLMADMERG